MQVTIEINGRQALPVRAIPLLTDWRGLSPDQLAKILAGDSDHWPSFDGLTAYRLHPDGSTEPIPPRWWASWVVGKLQATSEAIEAAQTSHATGRQQWRSESLAQLPAGVFLWRDEFEAAHAREYGPKSLRARFNPETFDPSAHALDFSPYPDPDVAPEHLVLEGFLPNGDAGSERFSQALEWLNAPREALTAQEAAEQEAAWMDATLDAAGFFALGHVSPVEAAMLLCRHNPHEVTEKDAEVITCDPNCSSEITPNDFKRLRRTFVDLDHTKPGNRPLVDWMLAAAGAGRRVHPWAHRYAEHHGLYGPEKKPAPTPVEPPLSATGVDAQGVVMKRKALVSALEHEWPTIEADLREASRNGLKDAAATGVHSEWYVERASEWAQRKGKLKQAAPAHQLVSVWPSTVTRNRP